MTSSLAHPDLGLTGSDLAEAILQYASNPLYVDNEEWTNDGNPYRRQLRPQVLRHLDFDRVAGKDELLNYHVLAAHRLLTCIYEADLMLLPTCEVGRHLDDFHRFYNPTNRLLGERVRPALERHVFGFLDEEIEVAGDWSPEAAERYLRWVAGEVGDDPTETEVEIARSPNPQRAARMWLVQFAPDFLTESSPMIRNVLGSYGPPQSEWFKIIIDEYGYGVHDTKHSTLFARTLESVQLRSDLHHYWQFYLGSSLMTNNYFHYLGKNHELFFRYLGALFYTEATLAPFCHRVASLLRSVFDGDEPDVEYFTEHVHIDGHHGRMALDNVVLPLIARADERVIAEVVRGVEEVRLLVGLADADMAAQLRWMDSEERFRSLHDPIWARVESGHISAPVARIVEPRGELSNTHSHDGDELCHIVSGTMRFVSGLDSSQVLEAGQGTVIQRNRLHGAIIESDECVYEIHSIGDHQRCLS